MGQAVRGVEPSIRAGLLVTGFDKFGLRPVGDGPTYNRPLIYKRPFELFSILSDYAKPKAVVEIGSWEGSSAIAWGDATVAYGTTIVCVDTWLGSIEHYMDGLHGTEWGRERLFLEDGYPTIYDTFVTNIRNSGLQDRVIAIPIDSRQAFLMVGKISLVPDICYIDAAHDYDSVMDDLYGAKRIGSKIICGDDYYFTGSVEIKHAVDDFSEKHGYAVLSKENQFVIVRPYQTELYDKLTDGGWR